MKPLKLLQLNSLELNTQVFSNSDRVISSTSLYNSVQPNFFDKNLATRATELKISLKNKSVLQQRRAIRSILEHNSPQCSPRLNNFEVTGSQSIPKKFSVSPDLTKSRNLLLSPIPKSKKFKVKAQKKSERTIVRSETLNSIRRSVPLDSKITEKSEPESNEDSLRFEAKYIHKK